MTVDHKHFNCFTEQKKLLLGSFYSFILLRTLITQCLSGLQNSSQQIYNSITLVNTLKERNLTSKSIRQSSSSRAKNVYISVAKTSYGNKNLRPRSVIIHLITFHLENNRNLKSNIKLKRHSEPIHSKIGLTGKQGLYRDQKIRITLKYML